MTLVVGVKTSTTIQLISDTRITHADATQIEETPGRLKILALSPHICVGYAGPAAVAIDHVRRIPEEDRVSFDAVVHYLRRCTECDFIVADANAVQVTVIRDGNPQESSALAHIGDDRAWGAFQAARHLVPDTVTADGSPLHPDFALLFSVTDAFSQVLNDRDHPTVAGFKMRVGSRGGAYYYLTQAGTSFVNVSGPLNESTAAQYSDAAAGAYSYAVLTPRDPGHALVAVHIYQAQLGFVYVPLEHDRPIKVTAVDHSGLLEYVKAHHGIDVDGLRIGNSGFQTPG